MLINKSDGNDDIMNFPHSYYLFKHTYFDSISVYFSIISAKNIDKKKAYVQNKVS